MQTADEIYLFVCQALMKYPNMSFIPIEISKELREDRESFYKAFINFRSHVLQVFRDRILVHKITKINLKNLQPDCSILINPDILVKCLCTNNFCNGLNFPTETDYLGWDSEGRLMKRLEIKCGRIEGKRTFWHKNGLKALEYIYVDGQYVGPRRKWDENGQIISQE